MKRPKQLPAVDRNGARCACAPLGSNVRPSNWQDLLRQQTWIEPGGIVGYTTL